ncbi:unnamed protein product [Effrenium voratum]|nr:unnamed protein product [Effrenium voratum]CAJ1443182.1 unnamed protein product [Effrenium voratum]
MFRLLALAALDRCWATPRCSKVERFSFVNQCQTDIFLKDWELLVPARSAREVVGQRRVGLQRISWRFKEGPWDVDFIELNGDWPGEGYDMCGHPNFASWSGFSMSSRYEALDPVSGRYACADAGAELGVSVATCPSKATSRYACDFQATQQSIRSCKSDAAIYMQEHSWALNLNGTRSHKYYATQNIINYWCAPESPDWLGWGVGSFIDCTNRQVPIHFRVTTCIV